MGFAACSMDNCMRVRSGKCIWSSSTLAKVKPADEARNEPNDDLQAHHAPPYRQDSLMDIKTNENVNRKARTYQHDQRQQRCNFTLLQAHYVLQRVRLADTTKRITCGLRGAGTETDVESSSRQPIPASGTSPRHNAELPSCPQAH